MQRKSLRRLLLISLSLHLGAALEGAYTRQLTETEGGCYSTCPDAEEPSLRFPYNARSYQAKNMSPYGLYVVSRRRMGPAEEVCFKIGLLADACVGLTGTKATCCKGLQQDLHRLEFAVNDYCCESVISVTMDGKDKTHEYVPDGGDSSGIFRIMTLRLNANNASDPTFCIQLGGRCPSLKDFSMDGTRLVWAMSTRKDGVSGIDKKYSGQCIGLGTSAMTVVPMPAKSPRPSPSGSPAPTPSPQPGQSPQPGSSPAPNPDEHPSPSPPPPPPPPPEGQGSPSPPPPPPPPPYSPPVGRSPSPQVSPSVQPSPSPSPKDSPQVNPQGSPVMPKSPSPSPAPQRSPAPGPGPSPNVYPQPSPKPGASPSPAPSPAPGTSPTPNASPSPRPASSPTPAAPSPSPSPSPAVSPSSPKPGTSPTPGASPSPKPGPSASPSPSASPAPGASPSPSPAKSPAPGVSPSPSASPAPGVSPSPSASPAPGVSPTPSASPAPGASPSPSASPAPGVSPSPSPSPSVADKVNPFQTPANVRPLNETNFKPQLYTVDVNATTLVVSIQVTVMDRKMCSADKAGLACDVLSGVAIPLDPRMYGGLPGLLDAQSCSVSVIDDTASDGRNSSAMQLKVSNSTIPVIGVLLKPPVDDNSAARITFYIPRVPASPSDAVDPRPNSVELILWGQNVTTNTVLGVAKPVLNPAILDNPGAVSGLTQTLSGAGMQFNLTREVMLDNITGTEVTHLTLTATGPVAPSQILDAAEPLYINLDLLPSAVNNLSDVEPFAITYISPNGTAGITFTAAPSAGQSLSYECQLPGVVNFTDICKNGSCNVTVIGSNGISWEGAVNTTDLGYPTAFNITDKNFNFTFDVFPLPDARYDLTYTNFEALLYTRASTSTTLDVTYQLATSDIGSCRRFFASRRCGNLTGFAALLDPAIFGTNWDLNATTVTTEPSDRTLTMRTGSANGMPVLAVTIDPPMTSNDVILLKFVIPKLNPSGSRKVLQSGSSTDTGVPPHRLILWGPNFTGLQQLGTVPAVFSPVILNTPDYGQSAAVVARAFNQSGLEAKLTAGNTAGTSLALSVADAQGKPLSRPLYVRMFLASNILDSAKLSGSAKPSAAAYYSGAGKDVTWTVAPTANNTFKYTFALPAGVSLRGPKGLSEVCAKDALPGQPAGSCALQVINNNQTVYNLFITEEDMGLRQADGLRDLLPSLVIGAPTVNYPLSETNWDVQLFNATENATAITINYLISSSDLATCNSAGLKGCSPYDRIAIALNTSSLGAVDVEAITVTNPSWVGGDAATVQVNSTGGAATSIVISETRQVGAAGSAAELYTVIIPKTSPGTILANGPNGLPIAPPAAVLIIGQAGAAAVTVGSGSDPLQTYDPEIMENPSYTGTERAMVANCLNMTLARALTQDQKATKVTLVANAWSTDSACQALLNSDIQRPLYLRVLLSTEATAAAASTSASSSYSPAAGAVLAPATTTSAVSSSKLGGALTWSNVPYWGNSFTYTMTLPGLQAVNDLCAQNQVKGQAPDTCVIQVISGGNDTVWTMIVAQPASAGVQSTLPVTPDPRGLNLNVKDGLSYNEKVAIIVCTVVGGILLLLLLLLILLFCHRRNQKKWAPAKSATYSPPPSVVGGATNSDRAAPSSSSPPNPSMPQEGTASMGRDSQVSALSHLPDSLAGGHAGVAGGAGPSNMGGQAAGYSTTGMTNNASSMGTLGTNFLPVPPTSSIAAQADAHRLPPGGNV